MASLKPEEHKPVDYFKEVKAAQKQEKAPISNLVSNLRTDMVPASDVIPARKSILQRENLRAVLGILFGLVIIGLILISLVGPGRPFLEHNLVILAQKAETPTFTASPTWVTPTLIPVLPTQTSTPTATLQPTRTRTTTNTPKPTVNPPTPTPTVPECRDASSVTLLDVGQTLCVRGTVLEIITNPTDITVIFSFEYGVFYWVSYEVAWQAQLNKCYQVHGTIHRIGNNPIQVFDYKNLPEACP